MGYCGVNFRLDSETTILINAAQQCRNPTCSSLRSSQAGYAGRWAANITREGVSYMEGWHVGGVCIHPSVQRKGIGTLLMEQAHADLSLQELEFAVLNCGHHLVRFYEKVGYTKVSDRALYLRDGKLAMDEDPAFAISFRKGFDITVLMCEVFPFGFDF